MNAYEIGKKSHQQVEPSTSLTNEGICNTLHCNIIRPVKQFLCYVNISSPLLGSQGVFFVIWNQFHQCSMSSFYACRSQMPKKDCQVKQLFCTFGICARKSCSVNVGEIDPWNQFHQHFTSSFCTNFHLTKS